MSRELKKRMYQLYNLSKIKRNAYHAKKKKGFQKVDHSA